MVTMASPGTLPGLGCRVAHVPTSSGAPLTSPETRAATGEASLLLAPVTWLMRHHWEADGPILSLSYWVSLGKSLPLWALSGEGIGLDDLDCFPALIFNITLILFNI